MNRKTLVMLDLDGTIIDTSELLLTGIPEVVMRHLGVAVDKEEILGMWGKHARKVFYRIVEATRDEKAEIPEITERMYSDFCRYYNDNHNRVARPYAGVPSGLDAMKNAGFRLGIVTTRPLERSGPVLEMAWASRVDFFVWGDSVERNKPFPDGLDYAMKTYAPGTTGVYAGDTPQDMAAAKASRYAVDSVAAMWGTMDPNGLAASGPDFRFDSFTDFSQWVIHHLA